MMNVERFANNLEAACTEAQIAARTTPGLFGGRYVARIEDGAGNEDFEVLDTDDPDHPDCENRDIFAHVRPDAVYAIGRARNYLDTDGCVARDYFEVRS